MAVKMIHVVCGACRAEVDRIEYDADTASRAVSDVMAALGMELDAAIKLVKKNNPGAELSSEERARSLAAAIVAGQVEGRPEEVDLCPNGHDAGLEVTDDNPTPAVSTTVVKTEAK